MFFFSVVASLIAAISSEIKAMAVAVVVEDGSGAGTTTCCRAPCAIALLCFWVEWYSGMRMLFESITQIVVFCVALVVFVVLLQRK